MMSHHILSLWITHVIEYILTVALTSVIAAIFFTHLFDYIPPNLLEDHISLLGTLVQSQATIITIFIAIMLVIIQLSTSSFSSKVPYVAIRYPDTWISLILYIILLIYGVILIQFYSKNSTLINFYLALSIGAFVVLLQYSYNMVNFLKTKNMMQILVFSISASQIKHDIQETLQPFFELACKACKDVDISVLSQEFKLLNNRIFEIIYRESNERDLKNIVTGYYLFLSRCIRMNIECCDEDQVNYMVNQFFNYNDGLQKNLVRLDTEDIFFDEIDKITSTFLEANMKASIIRLLKNISKTGSQSFNKNISDSEVDNIILKCIARICSISIEFGKKEGNYLDKEVNQELIDIGRICIKKNKRNPILEIISSFEKIDKDRILEIGSLNMVSPYSNIYSELLKSGNRIDSQEPHMIRISLEKMLENTFYREDEKGCINIINEILKIYYIELDYSPNDTPSEDLLQRGIQEKEIEFVMKAFENNETLMESQNKERLLEIISTN